MDGIDFKVGLSCISFIVDRQERNTPHYGCRQFYGVDFRVGFSSSGSGCLCAGTNYQDYATTKGMTSGKRITLFPAVVQYYRKTVRRRNNTEPQLPSRSTLCASRRRALGKCLSGFTEMDSYNIAFHKMGERDLVRLLSILGNGSDAKVKPLVSLGGT